jgi:heptaprenyl diphosphate synthase
MRLGVYTLPVLHSLATSDHRDELVRILGHGAPDGELLDRALEIVRSDGSIEHARASVTTEVARATTLAARLPEGPARHALIQLAKFLAVRCGAEVPD